MILKYIFFFIIALIIYISGHYYVYKHIKLIITNDTLLKLFKYFFLLSASTFILGNIGVRIFNFDYLLYYGYVWLGIIGILLTTVFLGSIAGKIFLSYKIPIIKISVILGFLISIYSYANVNFIKPTIKKYTIPVKNLSSDLNGFRIVQISDLHIDYIDKRDYIENVFKTVNMLNPDIVVITGDLVDRDVSDYIELFKKIKNNYGVYAITGNHEYFSKYDRFIDVMKKSNIKILLNDIHIIKDNIQLVGFTDDFAKRFNQPGPNSNNIIDKIDDKKPAILLYHQPKGFHKYADKGIDLQISGHTHSGQIPPMEIFIKFVFKYCYGMYKYKDSYLYVSSGTGIWGPPLRFLSRNEIPLFILSDGVGCKN